MPDRWMWSLPWELDNHFQRVSDARDAKYGNNGGDNVEEIPDPVQNEHAARFR